MVIGTLKHNQIGNNLKIRSLIAHSMTPFTSSSDTFSDVSRADFESQSFPANMKDKGDTGVYSKCDLWNHNQAVSYLNHGAFDECSKTVIKAQSKIRAMIESDPRDFFERNYITALRTAKETLASFVHADMQGLVLTGGATQAMNIVIQSHSFEAGSEILITNQTYSSVTEIVNFVPQRDSARVVVANVSFPPESCRQILDSILTRASKKTRLAIIGHIPSRTAIVFPMKQIVLKLKAWGIDTWVDGAHAAGMMPLNLKNLNAAYYVANCHK